VLDVVLQTHIEVKSGGPLLESEANEAVLACKANRKKNQKKSKEWKERRL